MSRWVKYMVMLMVGASWVAYLVVELVKGADIPLPFWSVPGATYALLRGDLPKLSRKEGTDND